MNPVTDPEVLAQLGGGTTGGLTPVDDPELLQELGGNMPWSMVPNVATQGVLDTFNRGGTMVGMGAGKFIEDATGFNPLVALVKKTYGIKTDQEAIDAIYKSMEKNSAGLKNYFNPQELKPNLGQTVAGMAGTLPAQLVNVPLQAGERGMSMVEMGENADAAQKATVFDAAANAAGIALPASAQGKLLKRAATGALANVAFGGASDQYAKDVAETPQAKAALDPFSEEGMKRRAAEAILGASIGGIAGERPKSKTGRPNIGKNLDEFDKADTSLNEANLRDLEAKARDENFQADQRMRRRGGPMADERPIYVDSAGTAGAPILHGPYQTGEEAARIRAAEQGASTMSLADESQYPVNDRGSRPVGSDGTPLRGMAEDVPTVDFPLRQEVLDSDPVRQMSDFAAEHVGQMRKVVDDIWAKIDKQTEFMSDWQGSKEARQVEDANLAKLMDDLHTAQTQLFAMEQGVRSAWSDFGVTDAYSASGRPLFESASEPHSKVKRTFNARAEADARIKARIDALLQEKKKSKKTLGQRNRKQRGGAEDSWDPGQIRDDILHSKLWLKLKTLGARLLDQAHPLGGKLRDRLFVELDRHEGDLSQVKAGTIMDRLMDQGRFNVLNEEAMTRLRDMDLMDEYGRVTADDETMARVMDSVQKMYDGPLLDAEAMAYVKRVLAKTIADINDSVDIRYRYLTETIDDLRNAIKEEGDPDGTYKEQIKENQKAMKELKFFDPEPETWKMLTERDNLTALRKKQGGAIHPDLLGIGKLSDYVGGIVRDIKNKVVPLRAQEIVSEVEKTARRLNDDDSVRDSVLKNIGANEIDLVAKDPPVEAVAKAAKDEPDVGGGRALSAGALSKSETNNSSALKGVYRWWDNATKRAERFNRDFVKPAASALRPLFNDPEALGALKYVFERELQRGSRYSPEQLAQAGLDQKQLEAYQFLRDAFDKAISVMNEARVAKGKKPIDPMDAYMASRWRGPWRATVTDADGKIIWQIHETSKWGAKKATDYIKEHFPDLKISDVTYRETTGRISQDLMAGYLEMLELLDADDPRVLAVKKLVNDSASQETVNIFGQEKHFKKKTGVRGFAGDRPWADSAKDNKEFFMEQLQYVKNAFEWAEKQRAAEFTTQLLSDPDIKANRRNLYDYVTEYSKHQLGIGTNKVFDAVENFVAKSLGISPQHLDTTLGVTKSIFYTTKLGMMNLPFSVAQVIQPIFTAPMHSVWSGDGYSHNTAKTYADATANGLRFVMMHIGSSSRRPALESHYFKKMPTIFKEAALYAEQNGVVDINPLSDVADLHLPEKMKMVQDMAGFNIKYSEQIARATAFMSFVSHLEQSGKFDKTPEGRMKMFQMAEDATKFTMVDYRPAERAMLFQRAGLFGNALSTLNTFKINQVNQMIKYVGEVKKGNVVPAAQFFGAYLMTGGLVGFVGIEDADSLYQLWLESLSDDTYAALPKELREFSIKKAIIENAGDFVAFGGVSKLTGLDIYRRFDSSNLMPVDPDGLDQTLSSLFPFISDTYKTVTGAANGLGYLLGIHGDKAKALAGGYAAMPTSLKGPYEANMPGWKSEETGVYPRPSDPSAGVYARDPEKPVAFGFANEENIRNTGFRSLDEARTRDIDFHTEKQDRIYSKRRASFAKKVRNNIVLGSPQNIDKALNTYFELGGDPETLLADAQIDQQEWERHSSKYQKLVQAADSGAYPAVERLVRYLKAMGLYEDVR